MIKHAVKACGQVLPVSFLEGIHIQTNNEVFNSATVGREIAEWKTQLRNLSNWKS